MTGPPATPAPTLSPASTPAPPGTRPATPVPTLAGLRAVEAQAATDGAAAVPGASRPLAALLASIAASEASHDVALA